MFADQIARGVALLDAKVPGWAQRVDVQRLDMAEGYFYQSDLSSCGCVCAQLDGWSFKQELRELGLPSDFGSHHRIAKYGFVDLTNDYQQLTREWCAVIATRQGYRGPR